MRGFYAAAFQRDAESIASATAKIQARLRNAADMATRHHERAESLADAVEHVVKRGSLGKQSRRRLEEALREYGR